ncbi:unnamed protein product [Protopolystoma xenopodis]|uniref:RING-type domain-containing protein n=1 Tax=Protopolystoma xenopodis TaxID=117903 RepID=A0A448X1A3_9PLAT|nr:unnamed protein product [Protopolystoma xenopodis]
MPCAHKTRSSDSESYSARSIAPLYKPNITSGVTSALDSLPATLSTEPPPVQILTSVYSPPNLNPLPTVLTDESTAYLTSSSDLHAPFSYPNNSGFTMLGPPIRSDTLDPYDADSDDTDTQQLNTPDQLFSGGRPHFIRTSSRRRNSSLLARSRWGRHSARCTSFSSVLRNPTHDKDSSLSPSSSSSTSLLSYLSFSGSESNLGSNSQDPLVSPSSQNHELSTFVFSPNSLADTHETFPCVPAPPLAARPPDGSLFLDQLSTSIPESTVSSPACSAWPSWVVACEKCVVCWRQFRPATRLGALPCGHAFHETCIRRWLDTGALACPICRWPAHALHLRQLASLLAAIRPTSPEANPSSDHAF